ncbi:immune inhibitor A domain-containing protein [Arthrobacter sp. NEB 688]|uniref:immune inhibitor A domain-containing protein n=1 Tax=Arthrobacter sp. NEB 688 TaxID=904039 RepID=UPI0015644324|nr:immune inhibitor A domain-containing protein [Arthrobacter sp. NEB 688]QKE85014.1 M6 family metalloprotease domain-containing protein [Arthrobacter sp. NEB 688]
MRKTAVGLLSVALATGLGTALAGPGIAANKPALPASEPSKATPSDSLPDPIADKQSEMRQAAISSVLKGEAKPRTINGSTVVKVGKTASAATAAGQGARSLQQAGSQKDQYVELSRESTDQLFVLVVDFGNERHPDYPDQDTNANIPGPSRFNGPAFNEIPEPNRAVDNSTDWHPTYDRAYYQDLYFGSGKVTGRESMRQYYERQSSGRYSVAGMATDPVKVRYNEARYGRSDGYPCASNVCSNTWNLVQDGMNAWVAQQKAAGKSNAQINNILKKFDIWDRYDKDGDGNFNEPDGYIDHLQIVHAGGDQADGDPYQGEDAIWSHRWRAFQTPNPAAPYPALGGTQIGTSSVWAADYTVQPENGGLSVVAHEYGHDLGLPDHYDTSGPSAANENPVNWWTLMAQSRVSAAGDNALGSRAADLSAWDKLQLGWLDYEVVVPGQNRVLDMGPHEYNSAKPQAAVVVLPDKTVTNDLGAPFAGTKQWYSGAGDDLNSTMSRSLAVPAGTTTLSFQARWNIEDCGPDACDYAFVEVDDGTGYKAIAGNITTAAEGNGIDGEQAAWTLATFDLSAYAGKTVKVQVRYSTDGAAQGTNPDAPSGIFVDALTVTNGSTTLLEDGAENGANGWTLSGFSAVGASTSADYARYYIASNREYVAYDRYLRTGPYNFGFPDRPDLAEHFPYQNGLLISLWDTSQSDNNTSQHPGEGLVLPIDAHPTTIYNLDGQPWRPRIQMYDATFGLQKADSFTLHSASTGRASYVRGQAAQPLFDDSNPARYFKTDQPTGGVTVAGSGTKIRVLAETGTSVKVRFDTRAVTP